MFKHVDIVEVAFDGKIAGKLALTEDHLCAFEYDADFINNGQSISPFYLPLKTGVFISKREPFDGLFGVFNDSLPDGWGMLLTDRYLIKQNIKPATLSPLDRLCMVGQNGMGALTYKPEQKIEKATDLSNLSEIEKEVEKILNNNYTGSIEALLNMEGSSGGARPKVLLTIHNVDWLIKFRSSSDPADIGQIEYNYSLAAKKSGIIMPETYLFENKYFGVRRFDKEGNKRYHVHTASGLLYASYRLPSLDYTELIKATMALTKSKMEVEKVFRIMVFNVLTHNRDDHAKNFSFMLKEGSWSLSPAYDLVLSTGFNGQHSTTIAGNGNPTKNDIMNVANVTGITPKKAQQIIDEVYEGCKDIAFIKL
jgi:serine/threonine-protein kinase HipA